MFEFAIHTHVRASLWGGNVVLPMFTTTSRQATCEVCHARVTRSLCCVVDRREKNSVRDRIASSSCLQRTCGFVDGTMKKNRRRVRQVSEVTANEGRAKATLQN